MALGAGFVGMGAVFSKIALDSFSPFYFSGLRFLSDGIIFTTIALLNKDKLVYSPSAAKGLTVQALLQATTGISWMYALSIIDPIKSSIAFLLSPILVYVGSVVFLKETRSTVALVGSLVAMAGGLLLFGVPSPDGGESQTLANVLLLVSVVSLAALVLHAKHLLKSCSRNYILGTRFLATGIIGLVLAFIFEDASMVFSATGASWLGLALSVGLSGTVALTLFYSSLKYMRAEDSAPLFYMDPLVGVIAATVILGDRLALLQIGASFIVVIGVLIAHPVHMPITIFYHQEHSLSRFAHPFRWAEKEARSLFELWRRK